MKILFVSLIFVLLLSSCVSYKRYGASDTVQINEIIIRNHTRGAIRNVQLKVERFNRLFGCSYILPKSECSTTFPARHYEGNWVSMSWQRAGKSIQAKPIKIPVENIPAKSVVVKGIIVIHEDSLEAYLAD